MSHTTAEPTTEYPGIAHLTERNRHRVLTAQRRRIILQVLADRTTPIDLAELTAEVLARQEGDGRADPAQGKRIETSMHHKHLPLLDDLDVLNYDRESHRVTF